MVMWDYKLLGVHLIRKLKHTENVGVVASQLLNHNQYMRQYLNVNVIIETSKCVTLKIKS